MLAKTRPLKKTHVCPGAQITLTLQEFFHKEKLFKSNIRSQAYVRQLIKLERYF